MDPSHRFPFGDLDQTTRFEGGIYRAYRFSTAVIVLRYLGDPGTGHFDVWSNGCSPIANIFNSTTRTQAGIARIAAVSSSTTKTRTGKASIVAGVPKGSLYRRTDKLYLE